MSAGKKFNTLKGQAIHMSDNQKEIINSIMIKEKCIVLKNLIIRIGQEKHKGDNHQIMVKITKKITTITIIKSIVNLGKINDTKDSQENQEKEAKITTDRIDQLSPDKIDRS